MLAINPLFISYSVQLMSDMPALFWDSAAMLAALKSRKQIN
jgi:4-amino-4-deoxy-L-arabinose transferase-like glycosyltransferase